ncbi:phosphatase PAP2 family protein [Curtobacterium sp. Csp1]|uniref:phosphatase PAP2 family protein n=1 Tax=unclassified Curtobacterium TaxID=257496 RepID=UPI001598D039|nr:MULTISPECIES: phosphatase PAP2 family protein [unclassified Curtobacterium]QKS12484.1 phosphatase PAP2 family protein [Curtobacterium sp. csp3]QKS20081.1 phosphatase PAP2 family protein [Curtobacterium sp. Csp1]
MRRTALRGVTVATVATALVIGSPLVAQAATTYPSDSTPPNLISLLNGYDQYWTSTGTNNLHGTVDDGATLAKNDELTSWINQHATKAQQFTALQDAEYNNATNTAYDQSFTVSQGLGDVLGKLFVKGRLDGSLPLTNALINSSNGTSGAYVGTGAAKAHFSYPRPYLPSDPAATLPAGDDQVNCNPATVNASSLAANRTGKAWADAKGNLTITRVPATTDTTHEFSPNDVVLDAGYGQKGICTGGSYPSGHTTTAYQAGITLATLVPELAPEILARTSEAGNDRIVLGVHYPLDIMGGRIDGEAALATRWSDTQYRTQVLEPARAELVKYLEAQCGGTLASCIAAEKPYTDDPYGGQAMPGGTAQVVTDRASAVSVYHERLTYGFARTGVAGQAPSVPAGASNLLLTAFPTLTDAQRTAVLAQTEIDSGYPLDQTGSANGSWERLDLAAATSATVAIQADGSAKVLSTGGAVRVVTGVLTAPQGTTVRAGSAIALRGTGLAAGATLQVVLHSDPVTVGTLTVGADGTATGSVTIPAGTAAGSHTLDLVDASGASVLVSPLGITVTAAASGSGTTGGSGTAGAAGTVPVGVHLPVVSG